MTTIIAILLFLIFLFLSGIHFYWGLGGKWAYGAVIPTTSDNVKVMHPSVFSTFVVALGLLAFGLIALMNGITLNIEFPFWSKMILDFGLWVIAGIFTLRAIGDFNYVGFFKKSRQTNFAQNDTKYYSPLCLIIVVLVTLLAVLR